jgi:hypothetical protein
MLIENKMASDTFTIIGAIIMGLIIVGGGAAFLYFTIKYSRD